MCKAFVHEGVCGLFEVAALMGEMFVVGGNKQDFKEISNLLNRDAITHTHVHMHTHRVRERAFQITSAKQLLSCES